MILALKFSNLLQISRAILISLSTEYDWCPLTQFRNSSIFLIVNFGISNFYLFCINFQCGLVKETQEDRKREREQIKCVCVFKKRQILERERERVSAININGRATTKNVFLFLMTELY